MVITAGTLMQIIHPQSGVAFPPPGLVSKDFSLALEDARGRKFGHGDMLMADFAADCCSSFYRAPVLRGAARTKQHMFAPLLEVQMSKKSTPLWREAHFEVKMYKTQHVRTTLDVQR